MTAASRLRADDIEGLRALLRDLTPIAAAAARAILAHDPRTVETRLKANHSPLSDADLAAESGIIAALAASYPGVPVISEERAFAPETLAAPCHFVVDPLDGTREFLAGNTDYVVCIALIANGVPVAGVIAAPALGAVWRGARGCGAEKLAFADGFSTASPPRPIAVRRPAPACRTVLVSRSHLDAQTAAFVAGLADARSIACGSALKFCHLAEGTADLYPRFGPVSRWDIAAGHALLLAAGGCVTTLTGEPLRYDDAESGVIVPSFIACGDPALARDIAARAV